MALFANCIVLLFYIIVWKESGAPRYDTQVRLVHNGSSYASSGFVEVYLNGSWGPVCNLGRYDADTACRQLGYTNAVGHGSSVNQYVHMNISLLDIIIHYVQIVIFSLRVRSLTISHAQVALAASVTVLPILHRITVLPAPTTPGSTAVSHPIYRIGGGNTGATAPVLWQLWGQCPRTKYNNFATKTTEFILINA